MTEISPTQLKLDSGIEGLKLAVERWPGPAGCGGPVLYVHGATFPSALSLNWRFADGRSWRDDLVAAGHDVWTFDLLGFGQSDRYLAMSAPPTPGPLGRADLAACQIAAVVAEARARTGATRVSLIAHSWGCIAAGRFAADHPDLIEQLVLFAPILLRHQDGLPDPASLPGWGAISLDAQWKRFTGDVPVGEAPLMTRAMFDPWGEAYLATDAGAAARSPPAVAIPFGPQADNAAAWRGELGYDPAAIIAPVTVVRGAWDSLCMDADIAWLRERLTNSRLVDVKLERGTHLMHLETGRDRLWAATRAALSLR